MGLDINGVRFLLFAQKLGADFDQTAMIGRQSLDLAKSDLRNSIQAFGGSAEETMVEHIFNHNNGYSEAFLAYLGAKDVHSFDISSYEGATHLHDMNQAIPTEFMECYSVVLDGGSLEHIFNFPIAMKNCMEMLKVGGYYLGILPANNFMGHGFYQFSPELYFSIFTPRNGFELVKLIAFEDMSKTIWYSVKSPMEVKDRVSLINDQPVYLLVIARKVAKMAIFETAPQQSDYIAAWKRDQTNASHEKSRTTGIVRYNLILNWVKRNLPFHLRYLIKSTIQGYGFNPRFFEAIDPTKL